MVVKPMSTPLSSCRRTSTSAEILIIPMTAPLRLFIPPMTNMASVTKVRSEIERGHADGADEVRVEAAPYTGEKSADDEGDEPLLKDIHTGRFGRHFIFAGGAEHQTETRDLVDISDDNRGDGRDQPSPMVGELWDARVWCWCPTSVNPSWNRPH